MAHARCTAVGTGRDEECVMGGQRSSTNLQTSTSSAADCPAEKKARPSREGGKQRRIQHTTASADRWGGIVQPLQGNLSSRYGNLNSRSATWLITEAITVPGGLEAVGSGK